MLSERDPLPDATARDCRECGEPAVPGRAICAACRNKRQTARIMADSEAHARHLVRLRTKQAIRKGRLPRQPCEVCGSGQVDAHHDDYSKPFEVRWLCRTHHKELHRRAETHCKRGHLLSGDNLYVRPDGERNCRACKSANKRAWTEARRVARSAEHAL